MSWDDLVASALVGTARRPPAVPVAPPGSVLEGVLGQLDGGDAEGTLLTAGAVVGLYRQAGMRPPVDTDPPPAPCPSETRPRCSEAAAARLDAMLGGRFRVVLAEWLDLARHAQVVVRPDRLPALLDVASANLRLRAAAADVAGERGRWLAGLNPSWAWASGRTGDPATWATGPAAARRLLFEQLRTDDPAAARALLEGTWATETPDDRAVFVALLGAEVSMEDEPFLEAALDDRRKEVRQAAADVLAGLPGSRLGGRMAERARPLVRSTAGRRIEVTLPAEADASMARDGVVAKPPPGHGARAWWLEQLVAATPLATWTEGPARLLELARTGESGAVLRQAWAAATIRQRDPAWAAALLDEDDAANPALLGVIPPDEARRMVAERVVAHGLTPAVLNLLDHCPRPWGPGLSGAVVQRLGPVVSKPGRPDRDAVALRGRLADLALRLDPSAAPAAAAAVADATGWWSDVVGWFADLLAFRADMREELPS